MGSCCRVDTCLRSTGLYCGGAPFGRVKNATVSIATTVRRGTAHGRTRVSAAARNSPRPEDDNPSEATLHKLPLPLEDRTGAPRSHQRTWDEKDGAKPHHRSWNHDQ